MDAGQALADLTQISSQIEAAVLVDPEGAVLASTLGDEARSAALAGAALELLREAERAGRESLVQLQASTSDASVFVVRHGDRFVTAVTGPRPTAGLVFYDLKSCLRVAEEEQPSGDKPAGQRRTRKVDEEEGSGDGGA